MIQSLSSLDVQSFIRQHELDDVSQLILGFASFGNVPMRLIAEQITGRKKAKEKLPTYYQTNSIVYPPGVNLEQCSSELTARFKSEITMRLVENREKCLDLTGGFGVDSYFFSTVFQEVCYVEPNKSLLDTACHNHQVLQAKGILHLNTSADDFLAATDTFFDLIYIDPSRRTSGNKRVFSFDDCEPDVIKLLPLIFRKTNHLLIKASPLLDIQQGIKSLRFVKHIFVISVENECKELLFYCENNFEDEPTIEALNLSNGRPAENFAFKVSEERLITPGYSRPLSYLYEPNASILKAGAFKIVGTRFNVDKLHPHTHLYTSEILLKQFPGRIFSVIAHVKPNPKGLDYYFPQGKANITTRNYPLTVKELRERTGLKDGGDKFLIGFTGLEKKYLVVAEKIS